MLLKVVFLLLKIKMTGWRDVSAGKMLALPIGRLEFDP